MNQPGLERLRAEWRQNRRLRLGALAILAIVGMQLVLMLSDARVRRIEQYQRDARLLARLEEASGESAWTGRAKAADAVLAQMRASIPVASSEGLAQAELQAWLSDLAVFAGIGNPVVRVETALVVEGHPELWQVLARLEGDMSESQAPLLMRTLSAALPWYQTERLQVQAGITPRVSLVMRGYFRKGDGKQVAARRPAGLPSAEDSRSAGAAAPPERRNPLAPPDAAAGKSPQAESPRSVRRNPLAPPDAGASGAGTGGRNKGKNRDRPRAPRHSSRSQPRVPRSEP
jgi:hypothetical protein